MIPSGCSARIARASSRAVLPLMLAAGCTFQGPTSAVPGSYDFGPAPHHVRSNPAIPGTVLVAAITAPAWLNDEGVAYRLLYDGPAQPRTYTLRRWAAEPGELIRDRLRSRLASAAEGVLTPAFSARSDYTLRVELEDFSQHFERPGQSRALLRARASLLHSERRTLIAQQVFEIVRPAAPDGEGAIKALTEAADAFVEEVVKWTAVSVAKSEPIRATDRQR